MDRLLLQGRPTLNPYLWSASQIYQRMLWDINYQSWRSRGILKKIRNTESGRKAVILCNGPSLNKVDFDLVNHSDAYTFGLNKINLLFGRTSFRPNCIVAVNALVLEQNSDYYNSTDITLYLDSFAHTESLVNSRDNTVFLHSTAVPGFARDCSVSINQGHTVTFVALQLAFHMGFSNVALVGADHDFASIGEANKVVASAEIDVSHFDPSYFSGGMQWNLPDIFESEVAYGRARRYYEASDRGIYNCTVGGKLEIFERMNLDNFLG